VSCVQWPPRRRDKPLHIAIPGSIFSVDHTLLSKTLKAGYIARVLAIHRVDRVWLYRDPYTETRDLKLLHLLLKYLVTPPHLKRKAFPLTPLLKYVGLLPPLNIPSHDISLEAREGEVLDGWVEYCRGGECTVYLGSIGYGVLRKHIKPGTITTVRIRSVRGGMIILEEASWEDTYSGYTVSTRSSLVDVIKMLRKRVFRVIATSRHGSCRSRLPQGTDGTLLVFGGPKAGLLEYTSPDIYDDIVNIIPNQGVKTVRTEEALAIALSKLE